MFVFLDRRQWEELRLLIGSRITPIKLVDRGFASHASTDVIAGTIAESLENFKNSESKPLTPRIVRNEPSTACRSQAVAMMRAGVSTDFRPRPWADPTGTDGKACDPADGRGLRSSLFAQASTSTPHSFLRRSRLISRARRKPACAASHLILASKMSRNFFFPKSM